jgi:hypothetical protein
MQALRMVRLCAMFWLAAANTYGCRKHALWRHASTNTHTHTSHLNTP